MALLGKCETCGSTTIDYACVKCMYSEIETLKFASIKETQTELAVWAHSCFGSKVVRDQKERAKRVVEEAIELGQASGLTADDCRDLVAYVFSRPQGEPDQEVAGVLVTTLVLAHSFGIDASEALRDEITRINKPEILEKIRRKQVSKEVAGIGMADGVPQTN